MDRVAGALCEDAFEVEMGEQKIWYLVAYDIRDEIRLRRVAKHLKGYGSRLQYSLFRCRLTNRQAERLRWEISQILRKDDDFLLIGLCQSCAGKVKGGKEGDDWTGKETSFEIVS
jgi:CRISPR-associated protein Cas2